MSSFPRLILAVAVCLGTLAMSATVASADYRFASVSGSGTACSLLTACDLETAINDASPGDEVLIYSGTYGSPASPISSSLGIGSNSLNLNIHGISPLNPPVIHSDASFGIEVQGTSGRLSDVTVYSYDGILGVLGAANDGTPTVSNVTVIADGSHACGMNANWFNSLCVARGAGDRAMSQTSAVLSTLDPQSFTIRNVTAIATGTGGHGAHIEMSGFRNTYHFINSIVRGTDADVYASSDDSPMSEAVIDLANSNFATRTATGPGAAITAPDTAGNQSAAPLFVNAAGNDFKVTAASPTVDAGVDDPANGSLDLAQAARVQGYRTDIGAFESPYFGAAPTTTTPPASIPTLSNFKQTKKKFKAAKRGKTFQASSAAKKKSNKGIGTTVSITSTGEGSIHFRLFKQVKKNGKKTWALVKGVETVAAAQGTNKYWFSGRWKGKKLAAGTYQLRGTPTIKGNTIKGTKGDEPGTVKGPTSSVVKK